MDRYLTTSEARQKFLKLVDEVETGIRSSLQSEGYPKLLSSTSSNCKRYELWLGSGKTRKHLRPCGRLWTKSSREERSSSLEHRPLTEF